MVTKIELLIISTIFSAKTAVLVYWFFTTGWKNNFLILSAYHLLLVIYPLVSIIRGKFFRFNVVSNSSVKSIGIRSLIVALGFNLDVAIYFGLWFFANADLEPLLFLTSLVGTAVAVLSFGTFLYEKWLKLNGEDNRITAF